MGKKADLSEFECAIFIGVRQTSLIISETAALVGFFPHNHFYGLPKIVWKRKSDGTFSTRNQDSGARIWSKQHEIVDQFWLV